MTTETSRQPDLSASILGTANDRVAVLRAQAIAEGTAGLTDRPLAAFACFSAVELTLVDVFAHASGIGNTQTQIVQQWPATPEGAKLPLGPAQRRQGGYMMRWSVMPSGQLPTDFEDDQGKPATAVLPGLLWVLSSPDLRMLDYTAVPTATRAAS